MLSFDTETTGTDLKHGCRPFFFAFCHHLGHLTWFEFDVDPFTRQPTIPSSAIDRISDLLCSDEIVGHNITFDLLAVQETLDDLCKTNSEEIRRCRNNPSRHNGPTRNRRPTRTDRLSSYPPQQEHLRSNVSLSCPDRPYDLQWIWENIHDTLLMSHAFRNLWGHSLKELRDIILFVPPAKQEALRQATNEARNITRSAAFRKQHGIWRIANERDPHWPAIKRAPKEKQEDVSGWWFYDTWLPRAIATLAPKFLPEIPHVEDRFATRLNRPENSRSRNRTPRRIQFGRSQTANGSDPRLRQTTKVHPWLTVLRDYALEDVESTLALYNFLLLYLQQEGLYDQYLERHRLLEITYNMQQTGVSLLPEELKSETKRYQVESTKNSAKSISLTSNPKLNLESPLQLQGVIYDEFKLPVIAKTKPSKSYPKGQPKTDADTLEKLQGMLSETTFGSCPDQKAASDFITHLLLSKRNAKSAGYLESYADWSTDENQDDLSTNGRTAPPNIPRKKATSSNRRPVKRPFHSPSSNARFHDHPRLHANYNITGTKFTRQSSSQPNLTNVGTGKEEESFDEEGSFMDYQLRKVFGPRQGRVWLARDYSNIELRIWAYDCGNKELIAAFENNVSIHLLIFRELWPQFKDLTDDEAKERPEYKWTKNGDFSILYGASPSKADNTYKISGAYNRISARFPEVRTYTQSLHHQVATRGFVETLTGYRLYIPRGEPHKAVSGRVQGTAGSIIGRSMIDTYDYLQDYESNLIIQVHDELVFDIPIHELDEVSPQLQYHMEKQGERISIPLPTGGKIHQHNWAEGVSL